MGHREQNPGIHREYCPVRVAGQSSSFSGVEQYVLCCRLFGLFLSQPVLRKNGEILPIDDIIRGNTDVTVRILARLTFFLFLSAMRLQISHNGPGPHHNRR
jgi:hypothetical protein